MPAFSPSFRVPTVILAAALVGMLAAPAPAQVAGRPDAVLWNTIKDTGYLELYEFFLREFPTSVHAEEARRSVAILKGEIDPDAPSEGAAREEGPKLNLDPLNLDIAAFQRALRDRGCNTGPADGIWGERTAGAAQRFIDAVGSDVDPSRPGVALFEVVLTAEGDVCGEL